MTEAIQFDWMDFAVASDAIKALRKNLAPECNVKRSGEWLSKALMDCCVKSGEVEFGVRVTGRTLSSSRSSQPSPTPMTWATSK